MCPGRWWVGAPSQQNTHTDWILTLMLAGREGGADKARAPKKSSRSRKVNHTDLILSLMLLAGREGGAN